MNPRAAAMALAVVVTNPGSGLAADGPGTTAYVGGRWFDGREFVAETVYVTDGRLARTAPARIDETVDLQTGFVIPPFAEAHNHNAADADPRVSERYLDAGVFYVADPDNRPSEKQAAAARLGRPGTIDAAFANGGFTSPGGHPCEIAARAIASGRWAAGDGEGGFFYEVRDLAELARKWPAFLSTGPDFVKLYILFSEQFERRRDDPAFAGRRGLDPALVPEVVARAHAAGLRVMAHIESAADFHVAVTAGVDLIGHLPGFRGPDDASIDAASAFEIAPVDARLAGERGTIVVTTIGGVAVLPASSPVRRAADTLHARNLRLLTANGVRLAVGSDAYDDTSVQEALYLRDLGVFDPVTLLRLWTTETARAIFPNRPIGRLTDGSRADFVVLAGDPRADFANVRRVVLTVKSGVARRPAPAAAAPQPATSDLEVTVNWRGAGGVDAAHPLLLFLFDHAGIGAASVPVGRARLETNGGTSRFALAAGASVYLAVTYDPTGVYTGYTGPPPAGTPIGYYLLPDVPGPAPAHAGERVTITFDGSTRFRR